MILLKEQQYFLIFKQGVQLPYCKVLGLENKTFLCKILSKLCRNSKLNISVNFDFALSHPKNIWVIHGFKIWNLKCARTYVMFSFLSYRSQSKAGVVNQISHLSVRRKSTIGQLNVQTATAEKEKLYTLSNIIYIKF